LRKKEELGRAATCRSVLTWIKETKKITEKKVDDETAGEESKIAFCSFLCLHWQIIFEFK
jgi:hypothetical protein